jgi:hypothetical protein
MVFNARRSVRLSITLAVLTIGGGMSTTTAGAVSGPDVAFAAGSPAMTVIAQIARDYWGRDACGGQVQISWARLDARINAEAGWWKTGEDAYADPDGNTNCEITFNLTTEDWPKLCTVAVHEYGHLNGRPHSADPDDVMAAYYTHPLRQCVDAAPPPDLEPAIPVPAPSALAAPVLSSPRPAHHRTTRAPAHRRHARRGARRHTRL